LASLIVRVMPDGPQQGSLMDGGQPLSPERHKCYVALQAIGIRTHVSSPLLQGQDDFSRPAFATISYMRFDILLEMAQRSIACNCSTFVTSREGNLRVMGRVMQRMDAALRQDLLNARGDSRRVPLAQPPTGM
jgi:hypothetical protein